MDATADSERTPTRTPLLPSASVTDYDLESMPKVADAPTVPEKWRRAAAKVLVAQRANKPGFGTRKIPMDFGTVALKLMGRHNIRRWIDHVMKKGAGNKDDDQTVKRRFLFDEEDRRYDSGTITDLGPVEDFNEVVDVDEARIETFVSQELVGHLTNSKTFNCFIFAVILFNAILIAIQTDEKLTNNYALAFTIIDQIVLTIFIFEIAIKWYYGFYAFWLGIWNVIDFIVIFILVLGSNIAFLSSSRLLRLLRVLRAFRSVRSVSTSLESLSLVVDTILHSIPDMANVSLLLFVFMLVASVIGVTVFGDDYVENFGNLLDALYVCFICVTEDGWVDIFKEMRNSKNSNIVYIAPVYFLLLIMIGAFVFSNLIVAVVVTNLEIAMREFTEDKSNEQQLFGSYITHTGAQAHRNSEDRNSDDDELDEEEAAQMNTVNVVSIDPLLSIDNEVITNQRPIQLPRPRQPAVNRLARYAAILVGLQEAMTEYRVIRADLTRAAGVLAELDHVLRSKLTDEHNDHASRLLRAASMMRQSSRGSQHSPKAQPSPVPDVLHNLDKLNIVRASDSGSSDLPLHRRVSAAILGRRNRGMQGPEHPLHRMNQY